MGKFFLFLFLSSVLFVGSLSAGELVVGCNAEFMPFEFVNDDDEIVGFDIDVIKAIASASGLDIKIQNESFDTLVENLISGRIDIVISGMTITEERKERILFSDPYYNAAQVIVVAEDREGISKLADLEGKVVTVQLGTTGATMMESEFGEDNENLKQTRKYGEAFTEVKLGRADAIVVDLPVANGYLNKISGLKIVGEPMSEEEFGIAVAKGNEDLLDKINSGLSTIKENGEFDKIVLKWFGE